MVWLGLSIGLGILLVALAAAAVLVRIAVHGLEPISSVCRRHYRRRPRAVEAQTLTTLVRCSPSRQASAVIVVVGLACPDVQNTEEPPT